MADPSSTLSPSKDELIQLIKRLGTYLALKMSSLFSICLQKLDPRSVGAIAGLAVAFIFTYRLMRSPSPPPRRQPKHQAPTTSTTAISTQSNITLMPSGVNSSSEDLRAQTAVDEFFQPVKPTLGQIVRQKLNEGRKKNVLLALENAGIFTSGGLVKNKVLFCGTENGRTSFVRQLEPDWHIDTNPEIVSQLARFIKYQLHVSPVKAEWTAGKVFSSPSLEHLFGCV